MAIVLAAGGAITRREQRKQELAERILQAGKALFRDQGIDNTTIDQICECAEVSRMTFYAYYPTKPHLIDALFYAVFYKPLDQLLEDVRAQSPNTITRLRLFFEGSARRLVSRDVEEHALIKQMLRSATRGEERSARDWAYLRTAVKSLIDEGQQRGDITGGFSADLLMEVIAGACDSIVISWGYDKDYPADRRLYELADFVSVMLRRNG